jgi:pimeloyl-ACP methyl ester carboxylesterase
MKMSKTKKRILYTSLFIVFAGLLFLHFYAPRAIIEIKNPVSEFVREAPRQSPFLNEKIDSVKFKKIHFKTIDNLNLCAYIVYAKSQEAKGTIVLLHGIRASKEHYALLCKRLANEGYNTVALDSRAHGESEGDFCTFGAKEKSDVSSLINYLIQHENISTNIGIWGQSLGAAIALQTMAIDKRISFGIIESTFSDFNAITHDYFKYNLNFEIPFLTNYLIYRSGKIADFEPDSVCPKKSCESIEQPILLVHGTADDRINIKYGKENLAHLKSVDKTFLEIQGADHLNVWKVGGEEYFNKVIEFINHY